MATTLSQVAQYLTNRGWTYELDSARSRIITGFKAQNVERFIIVISLQENGEYFSIAAPQLLHIKDHIFKGVLFQTMLAIAWGVKMLRWEYDPSDGEVQASIAIALKDAPLTERQFNRALEGLIQIVDQVAMPRLKAVMETGEDPGTKTSEQAMAEMLRTLPPERLVELQRAMAQLQQNNG